MKRRASSSTTNNPPQKRARFSKTSVAASPVATTSYVNKAVKKAKYSSQMVTAIDFDTTISGSTQQYTLTQRLVDAAVANSLALFKQGTQEYNNDGSIVYKLQIKIDAIKWQLRYALGDSEATDAVQQSAREIFWRTDQEFEEVEDPANLQRPVDDLDGSLKYHLLYGGPRGLYSDRFHYMMSQATDSDTTCPGQVVSKGYKTINYTDCLTCPSTATDRTAVRSEKGQLALDIESDDPAGANGKIYGYVELHWRFIK